MQVNEQFWVPFDLVFLVGGKEFEERFSFDGEEYDLKMKRRMKTRASPLERTLTLRG